MDKTHYADDETLARLIKLERVFEAAKDDVSDAMDNCGKLNPSNTRLAERCEPYLGRNRDCPDCPYMWIEATAEAISACTKSKSQQKRIAAQNDRDQSKL